MDRCSGGAPVPDEATIKEAVRAHYAEVAAAQTGCCGERSTRPGRIGYEASALEGIPDGALESFAGCGNPLALGELRPGEVVLDLGSGAGLDCFLAARQVGPTGRVIGLDMTPAMIEKAERNRRALRLAHVEFLLGEMEKMPLPDGSVDVVISNCVINLCPDKGRVFAEAFRVLRPGGRLYVSDIVLQGEDPGALRGDLTTWTSCIGGAIPERAYLQLMEGAGFAAIEVVGRAPFDRAVSAQIRARKPAGESPREPVGDYFARVAPEWDRMRQGYYDESVIRAALAVARPDPSWRVADVGTGTAFLARGLAPHVREVVALDASPEMLRVAGENVRREGLGNVTFQLGSIQAFPLPAGGLDAAFGNMVLHHAPDPAAAIREVARVVRPGGMVVLTDLDRHDHEWLAKEMADLWLGFDRDQVRGWFEAAGLTDARVESVGSQCCATSSCGTPAAISIFIASGRKAVGGGSEA